MSATAEMTRSGVSAEVEGRIRQFLGYEALLLDNNRIDEWLELLAPEIIYEIPLRIATRASADELPEGSWRVRDNMAMLRKRLERLATAENWAEIPASRTVRAIGSIYIEPTPDEDTYRVHSTLTLYRQRAVDRNADWVAARRVDIMRDRDGRCALVQRRVILAETTLQMPALSIFL